MIHRRDFLAGGLAFLAGAVPVAAIAANRKFIFKVRTKSSGIIGNLLLEAKDMFATIAKLNKRYPGCEMLEAREK